LGQVEIASVGELQNYFGFSIILNVKDIYSKYAIKIWKQDKYDWRKSEDIEWIKNPLDFGRKGEK